MESVEELWHARNQRQIPTGERIKQNEKIQRLTRNAYLSKVMLLVVVLVCIEQGIKFVFCMPCQSNRIFELS